MALPQAMRMSRREVRHALANGRRFFTPLGRVNISPSTAPGPRILFVVPKTISKKSSERNRIKRALDGWALARRSDIPAADTVVFVVPHTRGASGRTLRELANTSLLNIRPLQRST